MKFLDKKTIKLDRWFDNSKNKKERMRFVRLWAEYVKTHPDRDWSRQQKVVVDSQLKNLMSPTKKVR